ncbi:MAG: Hsp20/alpha crystallin family protein [Nitrososphaeria archaeon]
MAYDDRKRYEDFFEELEEMIEETMEDVEKSIKNLLRSDDIRYLGKPRFYGFSIQMDDSGMPKIKKFGNDLLTSRDTRTPFFDQYLDKSRNELVLIFELPGVEKEDIQLKASTSKLVLDARSESRAYHADVTLDAEVDPSSASSTLKNGILTINLKLKESKEGFTDINIE